MVHRRLSIRCVLVSALLATHDLATSLARSVHRPHTCWRTPLGRKMEQCPHILAGRDGRCPLLRSHKAAGGSVLSNRNVSRQRGVSPCLRTWSRGSRPGVSRLLSDAREFRLSRWQNACVEGETGAANERSASILPNRRSGYLLGACYGMTNVRLSAVHRIPLHELMLFLSMRGHCAAAFHPYFRGRADVPLQMICGVTAQLRRRTSTLTRQAVVGARSERDW